MAIDTRNKRASVQNYAQRFPIPPTPGSTHNEGWRAQNTWTYAGIPAAGLAPILPWTKLWIGLGISV